MLSLLKRAAPNRERLKAAIARQTEKQQAVSDARATVERLQAVIDHADAAAIAAARAGEQAKIARQKWVADGCLSNAREHHAMTETAAEAARAAQSAAEDAKEVSRALARAQDALQSLQIDLQGCEESIATARGLILAETAETTELLAHLERSAEEHRTLRAQAYGLLRVLAPKWNEPQSPAKSEEGANIVYASLERATIGPWDRTLFDTGHDPTYLALLAAPWLEILCDLDA